MENRFTDLIAAGYDLALRVVNTPQDNLIVKPLGKIDFYYVASPRFLAQHEPPQSADALSDLPGILPNYTHMATTLKPYNSSNNTVMMAQMALTGMGAAILPEWLIEDEIAQGRLVKLFEQPFSSVSIYLCGLYESGIFKFKNTLIN